MKLLLAIFLSAGICLADDVDRLISDLRKEVAVERAALATKREELAKRRESLHSQLSATEVARADAAKNIGDLNEKAEKLLSDLDEATIRREQIKETLERCFTLVRETRKDLQTPVSQAAPMATAFETVDAELRADSPRAEILFEAIVGGYWQHLDHCTGMERKEHEVILPDGQSTPTEILRLGGVAAYSVSSGKLGILESVPADKRYRLVPVTNDKALQKALSSAADSPAMLRLPLDVSGGRGLQRLTQSKNIVDILKAGGPIVIPLLILGLLALIMVIERTVFLLKVDKNLDRMLDAVLPALEGSDFDEAMTHVQGKRGPVANVVRTALEHGRNDNEKLQEMLQEGILAELPALERFLGALAVMAAAAPLLGLLGTVSGMIGTFEVISSYGTGNARMLSGGISEALITTEIGLIIAVPILLAHAFLNRQVRIIVGHMDRAALSLTGTIAHAKGKEKEDAS